MTLIIIGIAAWLVLSVAVALVLARAFVLNEESESLEAKRQRSAQLQLLTSPGYERAA